MKKIFIIIVVLFSSLLSQAQFSSATLGAAGLTCAMCTKAINNSLEKIPGIQSVEADIKNSAFVIQFKTGADIDPDALKAAVAGAGFSVASLKLTGNFEQVQVANDTHILFGGRTYHFLQVDKKTLNGTNTLTVVDKGYTSPKTFKKYAGSTTMACVHTGKEDECCKKAGVHALQNRIYHVTI